MDFEVIGRGQVGESGERAGGVNNNRPPSPNDVSKKTPSDAESHKPYWLSSWYNPKVADFYAKKKKVVFPDGKVERFFASGESFSKVRKLIDWIRMELEAE